MACARPHQEAPSPSCPADWRQGVLRALPLFVCLTTSCLSQVKGQKSDPVTAEGSENPSLIRAPDSTDSGQAAVHCLETLAGRPWRCFESQSSQALAGCVATADAAPGACPRSEQWSGSCLIGEKGDEGFLSILFYNGGGEALDFCKGSGGVFRAR